MVGSITSISIRMDMKLKAQADALFAEFGMNISTAFFYFRCVAVKKLIVTHTLFRIIICQY